jgi:hypothetical protein
MLDSGTATTQTFLRFSTSIFFLPEYRNKLVCQLPVHLREFAGLERFAKGDIAMNILGFPIGTWRLYCGPEVAFWWIHPCDASKTRSGTATTMGRCTLSNRAVDIAAVSKREVPAGHATAHALAMLPGSMADARRSRSRRASRGHR